MSTHTTCALALQCSLVRDGRHVAQTLAALQACLLPEELRLLLCQRTSAAVNLVELQYTSMQYNSSQQLQGNASR